ncbi:MAG: hypothetical protein R2940_14560 [Syntrophotaleaceae bacterium]
MRIRPFLLTFALVLLTAGIARADLDAYLHSLNISAEGDIGGFRTQVGAHFGASGPQIDLVFRSVDYPADAAVCFWLAVHSGKPVEMVVREYRSRKGQGWGALAKSLGIKPGSAEFHALKQGHLGWEAKNAPGGRGNGGGGAKGNGKGNGKN